MIEIEFDIIIAALAGFFITIGCLWLIVGYIWLAETFFDV